LRAITHRVKTFSKNKQQAILHKVDANNFGEIMKKVCLALSMLSLVLTTATPVMAASSEARAQVVRSNSVKNAFAHLSANLNKDNVSQKTTQFTKELLASGATTAEVINFATADMDIAQKAKFEDTISTLASENLANMSSQEISALIGEAVKSQASGAHYRDRNGCSFTAFLVVTAVVSGITGSIIALVGLDKVSTAKDNIKAIDAQKVAIQNSINEFESTGIPSTNLIIVQKQGDIASLSLKAAQEQKDVDSGKKLEKVGLYTLAGAGASVAVLGAGFVLAACD
jgi:hypothetical protein